MAAAKLEEKEQAPNVSKPHWVGRREAEHKFSKWWRPAMGWMYMMVCVFDFIIFPAVWTWHQGYLHQTLSQWTPLTLQGAGLFHMAMGAICGISAWNRTVEKLADKI